jgi:hypothetical protein
MKEFNKKKFLTETPKRRKKIKIILNEYKEDIIINKLKSSKISYS